MMTQRQKPKRTKTNPTGLPMKKVTISVPTETIYRVKLIAKETFRPEAVVYRDAIQEYVSNEILKLNRKELRGIQYNR